MRYIAMFIAAVLVVALGACQTRTVNPVTQEEYADQGETDLAEAFDPEKIQARKTRSVVEALHHDQGAALIRDVQYLIQQKELSIPPIVEALPAAPARAKANMLYVLGFVNSPESRSQLSRYVSDSDAVVRYEAAAGLLSQGDLSTIPILLDFLESSERQFRFKAIEVLRQNTGRDFQFKFGAAPEARARSVRSWRDWWAKEKDRLMRRRSKTG